MKIGIAYGAVVIGVLAFGFVLGLLFQKNIGIGQLRKFVEIGEQPIVTVPTAATTVLPQSRNNTPLPAPRINTPSQRTQNIPDKYQGKLQLFILAGQSNMSGRGDVPSPGTKPHPRIWVFGNDYRWRPAAEPVDSAFNQIDKVSEDPGAGFSPAFSFASTLAAQRPEIVIGLVPCARGGTSLDSWQRNLGDGTLYGSCIKRARAASAMGEVAGVLYFQGEADAYTPASHPDLKLEPDQWRDKFQRLVEDWRSDLHKPVLPVVFAQIGSTTTPDDFSNWELIQAQQAQVHLPHVAMITTADLALLDYVHFTPESYEIIGKRFAEAFLTLEASKR